MRTITVTHVEKFAEKILLKSSSPNNKALVESIIQDIKKNGDTAVKKYEKRFTGASIRSLRLSKQEIKNAYSQISKSEMKALRLAKDRLRNTEVILKSLLKDKMIKSDGSGIKISKKFIPIQSVGCYIPGGLARYPSSAIMSVVPAKIAGVKRIVVVSPPDSDGKINPLTVVAADICGATEIYKTGGAQSIAALSCGTKSISKVDKIVGPGGAVVSMAKYLLSGNTGIDMNAGPTELGIIADGSANPKFIALDLVSQAEHSSDTTCYLITTSRKLAKAVDDALDELIPNIQRGDIVKSSLKNNGFIAICKTRSDVVSLANRLAPEHLQIMTRDPESLSSKIYSPGLVLLGDHTPSSASDYILGSNHILPTGGFGKTRGSLSVLDFIKVHTTVTSSFKSLSYISESLDILTKAENLPNHYDALRGRLQ